MRDIRESTTLLPGGYINLTDYRSPELLRRFHVLNGSNLVRGVDSDSRIAFLSILLQSVSTPTDSLLLVCHFNASGVDHVAMYESVYQPKVHYWLTSSFHLKRGPLNIDEVQKVLVDRHLYLGDCDSCCDGHEMWSMEGSPKWCCRRTAYVMVYEISPVLVLLLIICAVFYGMSKFPDCSGDICY